MPLPAISGRVAFVFGDEDFDVDALAALAMRAFDPDFQAAVRPGDVLVGGVNFGYGHPHYPSMQAMRRLGIGAVLAESFSPGYWRGEISNGISCSARTCTSITSAGTRASRTAAGCRRFRTRGTSSRAPSTTIGIPA